jgi:uncharacterized membrane protein
MEQLVAEIASIIALVVEAASILVIFLGTLKALYRTAIAFLRPAASLYDKKDIWQHYAMWLLLGLEFLLGADIIRTAIAPSWTDIGQLAAIAAIRTFLNYFLTSDIEKTASIARPAP